MADNSAYRKEQARAYGQKLDAICQNLPSYMVSYLNAKASNCRISTRIEYASDLALFLEFVRERNPLAKDTEARDIPLELLEQMTFEDINEFQAYLDHGTRDDGHAYANREAAKARRMSSLRSFFKYECSHNYISHDPTVGAEKIRLRKDKMIERLGTDEVYKLLDVVENSKLSSSKQKTFCEKNKLRDTAILTLLLNTGIRVSELVGLDVRDIDFDEMAIYVVRKGGKTDRVFFNDAVKAALTNYLESERPAFVSSPNEKALFLSGRRQRMQVRSIQKMLEKYGREALPMRHSVSPHKMRKTYGTALYDQTGDIKLVADVLGHESVDTTARHYIDDKTEHKRRAATIKTY